MSRTLRTFAAILAMAIAMSLFPAVAFADTPVEPSWETAIDAVNAERQDRGLSTLTWWGDNTMAEVANAAWAEDDHEFYSGSQIEDFYAESGAEVVQSLARVRPVDQDPKFVVDWLLGRESEALLDPDATHMAAAFEVAPNPLAGECFPVEGNPDVDERCEPDNEYGVYTFHTITDVEGVGPVPPPFTDIAGTTHEDAIGSIVAADITSGFGDGTFRPGEDVSRGQMATFLTNALDLPAPPSDASPFSDVAGTTHEDAIGSIVAADITSGFGDGTFRPGEDVSRGQMATFLTNALDLE